AGWPDVQPVAGLVLDDAQRLDARRSPGADESEPEALALTHVPPADVHRDGRAVFAHDEDRAHVLDSVLALPGEVGGDALGSGPAGEPETEVDQGEAQVEHRASARLLAAQPPPEQLATGLERVPPAAHRLQGADVAARQEAPHGLDVGPAAVVNPHHTAFGVLRA